MGKRSRKLLYYSQVEAARKATGETQLPPTPKDLPPMTPGGALDLPGQASVLYSKSLVEEKERKAELDRIGRDLADRESSLANRARTLDDQLQSMQRPSPMSRSRQMSWADPSERLDRGDGLEETELEEEEDPDAPPPPKGDLFLPALAAIGYFVFR